MRREMGRVDLVWYIIKMQERETKEKHNRKERQWNRSDEASQKNSELMLAFGTIYRNIERIALIHKKCPMMWLSYLNTWLNSCSWREEGMFNWAQWQKPSMAWRSRETYLSQAFAHGALSQKSFVPPLGRTLAWENVSSAILPLWERGDLDVLHITSHIWDRPSTFSTLFPTQPPILHLEAISLPRVPACSSFPSRRHLAMECPHRSLSPVVPKHRSSYSTHVLPPSSPQQLVSWIRNIYLKLCYIASQ